MANDLLQRPDEDQDRADQSDSVVTPGANDLENLYSQPAITDDQRNTDSKPPTANDLENLYDQPARKDEDRNTDPGDGGASGMLNRLPSPTSRLKAIPGILKGIKNKKKAGLIGGGFAAFIVAIIIGIFSLLPLKLHSIIENVESRALDGVQEIIGDRAEGLVQHYILKELIPEVRRCGAGGTQVVKLSSCTLGPLQTRNGYASQLFNTWRNSEFQQRFLQEFDLEYDPTKERTGRPYRLITSTGQYDLFGNEFREMRELSRTDFSREVRTFIRENTRWYQVLQRSGLRRVAKSYGFRRFAVGDELNKLRDSTNSRYAEAKYRVKLTYARRVLAPLSQNYSKVFICIINGCSVDSPELQDLRSGGSDSTERLARVVEDAIDPDLPGGTDRLLTRIIAKDIIESILEKTAPRLAGKIGVNAIPVAGQIISAVLIGDALDRSADWIEDGGIEQAQRQISTLAYVSHYSDLKSFVDESKSGEIRSDDLGAKVAEYENFDSLSRPASTIYAENGDRNKVYAAEQIICSDGEPLPVNEEVCIEQKLSGTKDSVQTIKDAAAFSQLVSDADTCGIPGLGQSEDSLQEAIDELNENRDEDDQIASAESLNPARFVCENVREGVIDVVNSILGAITGFVLDLTNLDEQVVELVRRWVGGPFAAVIGFVKDQVFFSAIPEDPTGGENFNAALAGGISIGQSYIKGGQDDSGEVFGLGMPRISAEEYSAYLEKAADRERQTFASMSFFDRLKTQGPKRAQQFALSAVKGGATNAEVIGNNLASFFNVSSPVTALRNAVGPPRVYAAETSNIELLTAFDHYFYGIPAGDEYYSSDPEQYTPDACEEIESEWLSTLDLSTNEYDGFNPCVAERSITRILGTFHTNEDDIGLSPVVLEGQQGAIAGSKVVGDPYESSVSVACAPNTNDIGIHDAYVSGTRVPMRLCSVPNISSGGASSNPDNTYYIEGANRKVIVNSRVSGAVYAMVEAAEAAGVSLSANSSFRTMEQQESLFNGDTSLVARPGYSSHQAGVAIDFNNMGVKGGTTCSTRARSSSTEYQWLVENAASFGYKQYSREAWHWDMLDASNRCSGSEGFSGNSFQ